MVASTWTGFGVSAFLTAGVSAFLAAGAGVAGAGGSGFTAAGSVRGAAACTELRYRSANAGCQATQDYPAEAAGTGGMTPVRRSAR